MYTLTFRVDNAKCFVKFFVQIYGQFRPFFSNEKNVSFTVRNFIFGHKGPTHDQRYQSFACN